MKTIISGVSSPVVQATDMSQHCRDIKTDALGPLQMSSLAAAHRGPRRGFTLVELLVVIGIISALIALLLPALANARRASLQIKCAANLRSLGQAMQLHANEHQGYFPLAGHLVPYGDSTWWFYPSELGDVWMRKYDYFANTSNGNKLSLTALPWALAPYLGVPQITSGNPGAGTPNTSDPIISTLYKGGLRQIFSCPADENNNVFAGITSTTGYIQTNWVNPATSSVKYSMVGPSSYGYNSEVLGWCLSHDDAKSGTTGWLCYYRLRGQISACPHPSSTMLFMDAIGNDSGSGTNKYTGLEIWGVGNGAWPVNNTKCSLADVYMGADGVGSQVFDIPRHRGKINILFVDGHVESLPILSTGGWATPTDAVGSPDNTPSGYNPAKPTAQYMDNGALSGVSMNKDFY